MVTFDASYDNPKTMLIQVERIDKVKNVPAFSGRRVRPTVRGQFVSPADAGFLVNEI